MPFDLKRITESEWKKAKNDAQIPSSGVFASADQKNNIGPNIARYQKAAAGYAAKKNSSTALALAEATTKLKAALTKFLGTSGVGSGNRAIEGGKQFQLFLDLKGLLKQLETAEKALKSQIAAKGGLEKWHETDRGAKRAQSREALGETGFY